MAVVERVVGVVLTWNHLADLQECVAGLERMSPACDEILIVDNGSTPEVAEQVRAAFSDHQVISLEHNLGYTGGANHALAAALELGATWILFLATDTVPAPDMLGHLLAAGEGDEKIGLVGPRVMEYDSPETLQHGAGYLEPRSGVPQVRDCRVLSGCDWVTGCGFLVRAAALRRMPGPQGFDEDYFCYWEDVDFSRRVVAGGYQVAYEPAAILLHKESARPGVQMSDRKRRSRLFYMARNRFLFSRRHLGPSQRARSCAQQLLQELPLTLASSLKRNRGVNWSELRAIFRGYADGVLGRHGQARYPGLY